MRKEFFKTAGILLTIACAVISVILGVRAGIMAESVWTGVQTGGAFAIGVALFALGVIYCSKSWFDHPVAKVLFAVSLLGIAVLGVSLMTMMALDFLPVTIATVETGLKIGAVMFVAPMLLVMGYFLVKALIVYTDEHRVFSLVTLALAIAIGVAGYFVWGTLGDAFGAAFGFLFYWGAVCVIVYAWNGVQENEGRIYWRIGFALALGFLGSGLIALLSELLVNVPVLHNALYWVAYHVGLPSMYLLLGYVLTFAVGYLIAQAWPKLVHWAR
ncbi:MAG: hypothetical protein IJ660_07335 [Alphaproteobacteria bacterium]|nr:hypothetical protein [Alphaproteobacteria bacterium]